MQDLGMLVDKLYELRQQRLELLSRIAELEFEESELKRHFLEVLPSLGATGLQGRTAQISVTYTKFPTVRDWGMLYEHIHENRAWQLLQRRLNSSAVKELWQEEVQVPGVEAYECPKISITRL